MSDENACVIIIKLSKFVVEKGARGYKRAIASDATTTTTTRKPSRDPNKTTRDDVWWVDEGSVSRSSSGGLCFSVCSSPFEAFRGKKSPKP